MRIFIQITLVAVLVLLAYLPALQGGFIWDDDAYVTNNLLLTATDGWQRIWFSTHQQSQFFPLVFTTLRLEHALWGLNPFGYHLVNVLLHATNAMLVWLVLRKLAVPGAWITAALFAFHPVQVESVAWVTELKNTQSTLFYLLALILWLRFLRAEPLSRWKYYCLTLFFYVLALLSKTTACTLPAALLLVPWMQGERIGWRRLLQMVPFLVLGMAAGLVSIWWESHLGNYQVDVGQSLTLVQRTLVAVRALCFYAGKLAWPAGLAFSYPHWEVNASNPANYVWLLALLVVALALWRWQERVGRRVIGAVVFFVATLSPLLGFIPLYTFRYSYVADHYQYVASIGLLALAAAGLNRVPRIITVIIVGVLGVLTWQQCHAYRNLETLWHDTLAKNPDCWMAHGNLGHYFSEEGRNQQAEEHFRKALQINSNYFEAHCNLGITLTAEGRFDEAIEHHRQALQIIPDYHFALNGLGDALAAKGQLAEAIQNYTRALQFRPRFPDALNNLGLAFAKKGQFDEAIENYRKALQIHPDYWEALDNLGIALTAKGHLDEATGNFRQAIQINPNHPEIYLHLGMTLGQSGRTEEAAAKYQQALRLNPDLIGALNNLAWIRAANFDAGMRNGAEGVRLAERACELTQHREPLFLGTLAAAYAEAGRFSEAVSAAEKAEQLAQKARMPLVAEKNRQLLELYKQGKPYHEPAPTP